MEAGAGGVFEGIAYGVAYYGCLWASDFLPPYLPVSIHFLALSQAPPPLFMSMARRMPEMVPTMSRPATAEAPPRLTGMPLMVGTLEKPAALRIEELAPFVLSGGLEKEWS